MRILALDTATPATAVALLDMGLGVAHAARDDPPAGARPRHSTRLLELVEHVLDAAALPPEAVDRVAVGLGPGTFTGLRIGVATALGLVRAAGAEIVGVPTLTALALGASRPGLGTGSPGEPALLALLDARRGEVFAAAWASGADPRHAAPVIPPSVIAPETLPDLIKRLETTPLAVGNGAIQFRELLRGAGAEVPPDDAPAHRVDAREHAQLAAQADAMDPQDVRPLYLRRPDATPSRTPPRP